MPEVVASLKPTKEQEAIVAKLAKHTGPIEEVLPDTAKPETVHQSIMASCTMSHWLDLSAGRLKFIIGRLLTMAKNDPNVCGEAECPTFEQYKEFIESKTGMSRSSQGEALFLYGKWPTLPVKSFEEVGPTKLLFISKFTDESKNDSKKILTMAKKKTLSQLKEWSVDEGYMGKGETSGASILITGTKKDIKEIRKFLERDDVQAVVGSDQFTKIILAMTQECDAEWTAQGEAKLKEQEEEENNDKHPEVVDAEFEAVTEEDDEDDQDDEDEE